ncbi:hypothetical protein [Streptomyces xanthophaeus]
MSVATNLLSANTSNVETNTSGWTAGANTTLSHSTRFYQGTKSLGLTATGAGTVSATTATRVPVVAGVEYQAYGYFANVVAAASRTSTVTITWYAGSVGGSPIATSAGAATTLATATTWNTPPPQVTAVCPVGAAYASVTITVTGLSAGAVVAADVMALGVPTQWPGNLMSYTSASVETGTTEWGTYQNATIDRVFTDSWEGWYSLRITATASGATRVQPVASVPVTAGVEYVALAMVKAGQVGTSFSIELRWYDAGGIFISATPVTWTALPSGEWIRLTVIDTAPAGATAGRIGLRPTATAGAQTWLCDQLGLLPAPRIAGNLLGYAAQSMEISVDAWAPDSGCTIARNTLAPLQGAASMEIITTGGPDATVRMAGTIPVTPRQAYKCTSWLYHGLASSPVIIDILFSWYDAGGALIDIGTFRWETSSLAGWYTPLGSDVAPANAATLRVSLRINSPGSATYYVDEVAIVPGGLGALADVIPGAYGAAISLQGLTTGGHTHYGLWRVRDDGTMTAVRGESGDMLAVPITGDLAVAADYEAPLGVPVRYHLRVYTGSAYLRTSSRPVVIPEPAVTTIIVKDPVQPARQAALTVVTLPDWTRAARQGIHQISGRAAPIVISDMRLSRTGSITVVTETRDEIKRLWWLVSEGATLFVQWPSTWGEEDTYLQVGDVTESHIVPWADVMDRNWSLALIEVDRPVGGLTGSAARTWEDVETESTDWLEVMLTYTSWLGVHSGQAGT